MAENIIYNTDTNSVSEMQETVDQLEMLINQTASEAATGSSCPSGSTPYTVQRGDSFYLIARKFGVDVRDLMNANPNIAAGRLLVGDVLCVPTSRPTLACPVGSAAYVVQEGQTVQDVLLARNVSVRALRQYNEGVRLTDLNSGDVLCVPNSNDRGLCDDMQHTYQVQQGDTISSIASANATTALQLMRLNQNLLPTDFSVPGQVICLPRRFRTLEGEAMEYESYSDEYYEDHSEE